MSEEKMRTGANPEDPAPPSPVILPAELYQPNATELLINAQLAEGLAILRDAAYLYRVTTCDPLDRTYYVNQSVEVMNASAKLAGMIVRLKGGDDETPTTRQHYLVEHVVKPGVGGKAIPENE